MEGENNFNPDQPGVPIQPETGLVTEGAKIEQEDKLKERLENATKLFDNYVGLKETDQFLFVTDNSSFNTDRDLIEVLKKALEQKGMVFSEIVGDDNTKQKSFFNKMSQVDFTWISWDMNDTEVDWDKLVNLIKEKGSRMAFCPGVTVEALDNDGSMAEDKEAMDQRENIMEQKLREIEGFHITTSYGTDLQIQMKKGERRWIKDTGTIKQGDWDNLPNGEVFTTPDEEKIEGVLMLPVLQDEVARDQGVDEFVRLTIRDGKIITIDGGESAEKLRKYLEENSKTEDNPYSVLQCSEVAFGANSKARSVVSNPEGHYTDITNPTTETEKRLGTMHLAFGSSKHGPAGSEGHTESDVHLDFVIPRSGLTVTAFDRYDDFKKNENGQHLIDEGRWNFLE